MDDRTLLIGSGSNLEQWLRELRRRAEVSLQGGMARSKEDLARLAPEQTLALIHELQVHQIELEMQNEELRNIHQELEASWRRYHDLFELAPVPYLILDEQGVILECNRAAAQLLCAPVSRLADRLMSNFILPADQDILYLLRKKVLFANSLQSAELRLLRPDGKDVPARMEMAPFQQMREVFAFHVILRELPGPGNPAAG